eukprot:7943191-Heterocapsa_arctica.AAC.2
MRRHSTRQQHHTARAGPAGEGGKWGGSTHGGGQGGTCLGAGRPAHKVRKQAMNSHGEEHGNI